MGRTPATSWGLSGTRSDRPVASGLLWVYKFIRFPALGFTGLLPLLGAGAVSPGLESSVWLGLLGVAVMFHAFAYVLNDVVDLEVDKTEPLRADSPLVQQTVRPGLALAFALSQVPLLFVASWWMVAGAGAHTALSTAIGLIALYDLFGKRCPVPLLMDGIQALGWCALAIYGSLVAGGPIGGPSVLLAAHVFVYVMMINGVHGGLRDLANDRRHGARTTAVVFGARYDGGRLVLPRAFIAYALVLQLLLVASTFLRLRLAWPGVASAPWLVAAGLGTALTLASLALLWLARRSAGDGPRLGLVGALHLAVSLAVLPSVYAPSFDGFGTSLAFAAYGLPVLAMWGHNGVRASRWG